MINIWFDLFTMLLRFLTDANLGVEKLLVCKPLKGTCMSRTSLKASDVSSELSEIIQPMGVLMVKGWTRGLALQIILMAAFEDDSFLQARLFAIIHVVYFSYLGHQHHVCYQRPRGHSTCCQAVCASIFSQHTSWRSIIEVQVVRRDPCCYCGRS